MAAEEKSQSEKFIEKAKELGADESEKAFEAALGKVAAHRGSKKSSISKKNRT
jgi:hypothetical protein